MGLFYEQIKELVSKDDEKAPDKLLDASSKEEVRDNEEEPAKGEKEESSEVLIPHQKEKEESILLDLTHFFILIDPMQAGPFIYAERTSIDVLIKIDRAVGKTLALLSYVFTYASDSTYE